MSCSYAARKIIIRLQMEPLSHECQERNPWKEEIDVYISGEPAKINPARFQNARDFTWTNDSDDFFNAKHCIGAVMLSTEGDGVDAFSTADVKSNWWVVDALIPMVLVSEGSSKLAKWICCDAACVSMEDLYRAFSWWAEDLAELPKKDSVNPEETYFMLNCGFFVYGKRCLHFLQSRSILMNTALDGTKLSWVKWHPWQWRHWRSRAVIANYFQVGSFDIETRFSVRILRDRHELHNAQQNQFLKHINISLRPIKNSICGYQTNYYTNNCRSSSEKIYGSMKSQEDF